MTLRTSIAVLVLFGSFVPEAAAQKLGALQIDVKAERSIEDAVNLAVSRAASGGKWSFVDQKSMNARLPASSRGCFTASCLQEAGKATGADGGLRVRLTGQAQIYDWTVDVYDLHTGQLASSKKGACELCGVTEVRTEFEATARAAVASAKISSPKASQPTPRPKPDPEPIAEPTPTPEPEVDPINEPLPPLGDPAAGLVMVEIVATPNDAIISMGGQEIGRGAVTISVEPGSYEIQFAREGYGGLKETLVIGSNQSEKAFLRVHLARTDPAAVMVEGEGPLDRLGRKRTTYGIVGLAAGGALIGTGIILSAFDGDPTCSAGGASCPKVYETSALAFTTTLAGAVLATGGAVLLGWEVLTGREEPRQTSARVVPLVGPGSAGLGIVGRF